MSPSVLRPHPVPYKVSHNASAGITRHHTFLVAKGYDAGMLATLREGWVALHPLRVRSLSYYPCLAFERLYDMIRGVRYTPPLYP